MRGSASAAVGVSSRISGLRPRRSIASPSNTAQSARYRPGGFSVSQATNLSSSSAISSARQSSHASTSVMEQGYCGRARRWSQLPALQVRIRGRLVLMDRIDRQILAELQEDGRLSITELVGKVGLSLSPCHRRVRELERSDVITGYRAVVNRESVG